MAVENEIDNGPEQGGATSVRIEENEEHVEHAHLYLPANKLYSQSDEDLISSIVNDRLGTRDNAFIVNVSGSNLNDYSTPSLLSMAFPSLFPYGVGDVTRNARRNNVKFGLAMSHYLNYGVYIENEDRYKIPFAEHKRWVHWAQNTS